MAGKQMKIAYLTPGAGGMLCGSCLSDNTLVATLQQLGHEAYLIPLYTPITTDEPGVSTGKIFYGGVNVYLQQKIPLFRKLPRFLDRWLDRPQLVSMLTHMPSRGDVEKLGALTLSMVRGEKGNQHKEVKRLVDWLAKEVKPDVINLSNLLTAGFVPALKRKLDAPIVVTLQGDDLFIDALSPEYRRRVLTEMQILATKVDRYIVHSDFYAKKMAEYFQVPSNLFQKVPLGINAESFSLPMDAKSKENVPTIGFLARICPAKGLHLLVGAFLKLKEMSAFKDVRLHVAGSLSSKDRPYFLEQQQRIRAAGWLSDFHYAGMLDHTQKVAFLHSLDLFSVPTTYQEPKGRFVLEALACGVPVLQPAHGAFPELLGRLGGGRLFRPEDGDALATELASLLTDRTTRERLGRQGPLGVDQHARVEHTAMATLAVYENLRPCSKILQIGQTAHK